MRPRVTVVGILHIGIGIIGLIGGAIVFLALGWASTYVADPDIDFLLPTLAVIIGGGIALLSAIEIIGGIGVLGYRNWARILVLILSAMQLINIPIGTAIGIYSIVILVHADTTPLFEMHPYAVPPPGVPPAPSA
jgi:hypothetical protein